MYRSDQIHNIIVIAHVNINNYCRIIQHTCVNAEINCKHFIDSYNNVEQENI